MAVLTGLVEALPDYEISAEIGGGSMGVVYLARHRATNRQVAIRELPPSFAIDFDVRQRFTNDSPSIASLDHPHIAAAYEMVDHGGHLAVVMELLPNGTVWDQFVNHGLSVPRSCGLALAALSGLHHAHERGVVHRGLTPANLMFTHDWQVKVADIGLAHVLAGSETVGTFDGAILASPLYLSPEQAEGRACGPAADVYSMGAILYELMSGQLPFDGDLGAVSTAMARLERNPRALSDLASEVPTQIASVVMRALERRETARWPSAEAFGVALASASAEVWGADWVGDVGASIAGNSAIETAARTTQRRNRRTDRQPPVAFGTGVPDIDRAMHSSIGFEPSTEIQPSDALPRFAASVQAPDVKTAVRPLRATRSVEADLNDLSPRDLVNLAELKTPSSSGAPFAVAAALALACALLAIVGLFGSEPRTLNAENVMVEGIFARNAEEPIEVDFEGVVAISDDVTVSLNELDVSFLGIPVGSTRVSQGFFDPGRLKWTAAGVVELSSTDVAGVEHRIPVRLTNAPWATVPFLAAVAVAVGAAASIQSYLGRVRSRRFTLRSTVGLVARGSACGAALAIVAMIAFRAPTDWVSVIVAALSFGCAAGFGGEVFRRIRRRDRADDALLPRLSTATS